MGFIFNEKKEFNTQIDYLEQAIAIWKDIGMPTEKYEEELKKLKKEGSQGKEGS